MILIEGVDGTGTGGGGGSTEPLIDKLDPLFTEITSLIGELAGNEAVWSLLDSEENRTLQDGWTHAPGHFSVPGTYGFDTPALYVAMAPSHPDWFESEVSNKEREEILQEAVTTVWNDAHDSWTGSVVPSLYRSGSENVWAPDPAPMSSAANDLGLLRRWLHEQTTSDAGWVSPDDSAAPEWLSRLERHWPVTSQSAHSFFDFWTDVNDKCGLYLHAVTRLESTCAQATATISDFQTNLLETATQTRDRAREALLQWQVWKDDEGAWPTGVVEDNSGTKAILGGISYGAGVIGLFPPAAPVAGPVSVLTGTLSYLFPGKSVVSEAIQATKASAIHRGFVNDLGTIETNMTSALDSVQTQPPGDGSATGSDSIETYAANVVGSRGDWSPPDVNL